MNALQGSLDDDPSMSVCSAEVAACFVETTCRDCISPSSSTSDGSCNDDVFTCSGMVDNACCSYGDSCSANALLVAFIGKRFRRVKQRVSQCGLHSLTM